MRATAQAVFMAGVLAGSYGFGWFSDKWGRKPSFFLSVSRLLSTVSTFTCSAGGAAGGLRYPVGPRPQLLGIHNTPRCGTHHSS